SSAGCPAARCRAAHRGSGCARRGRADAGRSRSRGTPFHGSEAAMITDPARPVCPPPSPAAPAVRAAGPASSLVAPLPPRPPPRPAAPAVRAAGPASRLVAPLAPRYPARRMSGFGHLHVHTEYSLADSSIRVPERPDQADPAKAKRPNLLSRAVELGLPALAVTDLNNLFALIKFYKACEAVGIKPVAGADLMIASSPGEAPWRMTALVRDHGGYLNL